MGSKVKVIDDTCQKCFFLVEARAGLTIRGSGTPTQVWGRSSPLSLPSFPLPLEVDALNAAGRPRGAM